METDQQGLSILDARACVSLLGSARLGRIAVTHDALPLILPVAFASDGCDLYFTVGPGVLLRAAHARQIACFEADSGDVDLRGAWSVSAIGPLSVLPMSMVPKQLSLEPWSASPGTLIRLAAQIVTGRCRAAPL